MTMKQTQKMRSFFRNRVTKALGMTLALMMASAECAGFPGGGPDPLYFSRRQGRADHHGDQQ